MHAAGLPPPVALAGSLSPLGFDSTRTRGIWQTLPPFLLLPYASARELEWLVAGMLPSCPMLAGSLLLFHPLNSLALGAFVSNS